MSEEQLFLCQIRNKCIDEVNQSLEGTTIGITLPHWINVGIAKESMTVAQALAHVLGLKENVHSPYFEKQLHKEMFFGTPLAILFL